MATVFTAVVLPVELTRITTYGENHASVTFALPGKGWRRMASLANVIRTAKYTVKSDRYTDIEFGAKIRIMVNMTNQLLQLNGNHPRKVTSR